MSVHPPPVTDDQHTIPNKIFVGGLHLACEDTHLRAYFSQYGTVEAAKVQRRKNGDSRGFGFVVFVSNDGVQKCLSKKHAINGHPVDVRIAVPRDEARSRPAYDSIEFPGKVFVGGLPEDINEERFRSYFDRFGKITSCVLMRDKQDGKPRGFGFIEYENPEEAKEALGQHPELGRMCIAKKAEPKSESRRGPMSAYGPGGGYGSRGGYYDPYPPEGAYGQYGRDWGRYRPDPYPYRSRPYDDRMAYAGGGAWADPMAYEAMAEYPPAYGPMRRRGGSAGWVAEGPMGAPYAAAPHSEYMEMPYGAGYSSAAAAAAGYGRSRYAGPPGPYSTGAFDRGSGATMPPPSTSSSKMLPNQRNGDFRMNVEAGAGLAAAVPTAAVGAADEATRSAASYYSMLARSDAPDARAYASHFSFRGPK